MQLPRSNRFLSHMREGSVEHFYSIRNHATPRYVDFVCQSGLYDTIWIDLEHFGISINELAVLNMVVRPYPMTTLARINTCNYEVVMKCHESGVGGIICSMVNSRETAILCQIKTQEGLENVDEIVAVKCADGLFFGPGDFAHSIGHVSQLGHPGVIEAMTQVARVYKRVVLNFSASFEPPVTLPSL